jgi:hypothetical protein
MANLWVKVKIHVATGKLALTHHGSAIDFANLKIKER